MPCRGAPGPVGEGGYHAVSLNHMVAFCDILGFSALVEGKPLESVVENVLGWFSRSLHHSLHHGEFPGERPSLRQLQDHAHLGLFWFSDSILIFTKEDSDDCVRRLLETLGWLHFETITSGRTMIRSGIAYGEAHIDTEEAIFVGKPIIDAYQLEQSQAWSGGALAPSAVTRVPEDVRHGRFADWWVSPYSVPLKRSPHQMDTLAINWTFGIHAPNWQLRWSPDSEEPSQQDIREQNDVVQKFHNTKAFHDALCDACTRRPTERRT